jgi:uncharacterized membrane protein YfhO
VRCLRWFPEHRQFQVDSAAGGRFVLAEQMFPGWRSFVDGREAPIELAHGALQAIHLPAGSHTVDFRFESMGLRYGAVVNGAAVIALIALARASRSSRGRRRSIARSPEAEGAP